VTAQATEAAAPPRVDRALVAALIGNFLVRLDGGIVGQMITLYLADIRQSGVLEVTATTLAALSIVFYAVELIFSPIMGAKADQYGNRALLLVGPFFGVAAVTVASVAVFGAQFLGWLTVFIVGVSLVFWLLGLTRVLQGFSSAASIPSILSYLSVRTEGSLSLRGRVMAIFEVTTAVGLLGGYVIGPQLWKYAGAWGFVWTGLIFLSSAAFFLVVREDRQTNAQIGQRRQAGPSEPFLTRLRRMVRRRDLMVFVPAWLSVNAIVGLWGIHLVYQMRFSNPNDGQFLTDLFSENVISALLGGIGLIFCVGIIVWGSFVLGRLREVTVMRISSAGLFLICAAAFGVNHSGGEAPLLWLSLVGVVVGLAIMSGFLPAAVTYLARLSGISAADRGLLMGVYSVVLGLGQAVGIGLGGRFADAAGVDGIILLTFLLGLAAAFSVFRLVHTPDDESDIAEHGKVGMSLHA
jgi:MFS family permease